MIKIRGYVLSEDEEIEATEVIISVTSLDTLIHASADDNIFVEEVETSEQYCIAKSQVRFESIVE
jgi:hypothetical protein